MSKLRLVSVFLGLRRLVCDSLVQVSLGCVHLAEGCRRVRRLLRDLPLAVVLLLIPVQLDEVPERGSVVRVDLVSAILIDLSTEVLGGMLYQVLVLGLLSQGNMLLALAHRYLDLLFRVAPALVTGAVGCRYRGAVKD